MVDIEERVERAKQLFRNGYNCAQSVALAYADYTSLSEEELAKVSSPFGGGMGRMREVCGAVSGMTILAGYLAPSPTGDDPKARASTYSLVQKMAQQFRQQNKDIVCRRLLGLEKTENESPVPSPRTEEYYKRRPCVELVACAARILGETINER